MIQVYPGIDLIEPNFIKILENRKNVTQNRMLRVYILADNINDENKQSKFNLIREELDKQIVICFPKYKFPSNDTIPSNNTIQKESRITSEKDNGKTDIRESGNRNKKNVQQNKGKKNIKEKKQSKKDIDRSEESDPSYHSNSESELEYESESESKSSEEKRLEKKGESNKRKGDRKEKKEEKKQKKKK